MVIEEDLEIRCNLLRRMDDVLDDVLDSIECVGSDGTPHINNVEGGHWVWT